MLSIRINRSKDLRRTSSCSSLLKKSQNQSSESVFHKCFPLNLVYGKAKKNSVPIVVFQPVPEGVEHISHLIDSKCAFCHENCEKVHRDCMRLNIVSRGIVLTASYFFRMSKLLFTVMTKTYIKLSRSWTPKCHDLGLKISRSWTNFSLKKQKSKNF